MVKPRDEAVVQKPPMVDSSKTSARASPSPSPLVAVSKEDKLTLQAESTSAQKLEATKADETHQLKQPSEKKTEEMRSDPSEVAKSNAKLSHEGSHGEEQQSQSQATEAKVATVTDGEVKVESSDVPAKSTPSVTVGEDQPSLPSTVEVHVCTYSEQISHYFLYIYHSYRCFPTALSLQSLSFIIIIHLSPPSLHLGPSCSLNRGRSGLSQGGDSSGC